MAWLHLGISPGNPSDRTDTELRELQRYVGAAWESGWFVKFPVACRSVEIIWNLKKAQTFTHFNYQDNLAGKNTVVLLRVWLGELGFTPKANSYTLTAFPLGRTRMDLPARYHATAGLPSPLSSQSHLVTSRPSFRQVAPFGYTLLAEVPGGGAATVPLGRRTCWSTRFDSSDFVFWSSRRDQFGQVLDQFWSASIATYRNIWGFARALVAKHPGEGWKWFGKLAAFWTAVLQDAGDAKKVSSTLRSLPGLPGAPGATNAIARWHDNGIQWDHPKISKRLATSRTRTMKPWRLWKT